MHHRASPRQLGRLLTAASLAVLAWGCQPRVDVGGNLPDPDRVLEVQPGLHDRGQVAEILGSPSAVGTFDDKTWYYVGNRTETTAFFRPEVLDQQVLVVQFDDAGVVSDMKLYGYEDAQAIEPVARQTPTHGKRLTFLQQLFGNLGRFNTSEDE